MSELQSEASRCIKVFVGYAWQGGVDNCRQDKRWDNYKALFKKTNEFLEKRFDLNISFRRLRASHGSFVWPSVLEKISASDILIFDVGETLENTSKRPKKYEGLNANVLVELGAAMSMREKKIFVACPKTLFGKFPSDLSGYFVALYDENSVGENKLIRTYEDTWGWLPQYRSTVAELVEAKGWGSIKEEELENLTDEQSVESTIGISHTNISNTMTWPTA